MFWGQFLVKFGSVYQLLKFGIGQVSYARADRKCIYMFYCYTEYYVFIPLQR